MLPGANALVALAAAASWGGGDFSGGMGVKVAGGGLRAALQFIVLAHVISLAALLVLVGIAGEHWPHGALLVWGIAAGLAGGLALVAFYMALSRGGMGASAAVSGLLAAAAPAVLSGFVDGRPGALRVVGFVLTAAAIWMITVAPASDAGSSRSTTILAILGGLGFGVYFIALRFDNALGVLVPMALARTASITVCLLLLLVLSLKEGQTHRPLRYAKVLPWAFGVALLDTAGNQLFLQATRMGRLDVAAVLASLYPASTILLAAWRLHEKPTRRQWMGMGVAVAAVVLITV